MVPINPCAPEAAPRYFSVTSLTIGCYESNNQTLLRPGSGSRRSRATVTSEYQNHFPAGEDTPKSPVGKGRTRIFARKYGRNCVDNRVRSRRIRMHENNTDKPIGTEERLYDNNPPLIPAYIPTPAEPIENRPHARFARAEMHPWGFRVFIIHATRQIRAARTAPRDSGRFRDRCGRAARSRCSSRLIRAPEFSDAEFRVFRGIPDNSHPPPHVAAFQVLPPPAPGTRNGTGNAVSRNAPRSSFHPVPRTCRAWRPALMGLGIWRYCPKASPCPASSFPTCPAYGRASVRSSALAKEADTRAEKQICDQR